MNLLSLPNEVLGCVSEHVWRRDLINLALASKRLHQCCHKSIKRQSTLHDTYRLQHDRHPFKIYELLKNADGEIGLFIERFESWGIRTEWSQWTTFTDLETRGAPDWTEPHVDLTHLDRWLFAGKEHKFRNYLLTTLRLNETQADRWMGQILCGDDEPLRTMLISKLPHLRDLVYVQYPTRMAGTWGNRPPIELLVEAVQAVLQSPNPIWPPGFQSLRTVVLGALAVYAKERLRDGRDFFSVHPREFGVLLTLPNIKRLYLGYVRAHFLGDAAFTDWIPISSSPLEELEIEGSAYMLEAAIKMFHRVKALKVFKFGEVMDRDAAARLLDCLRDRHGTSLEVLHLASIRTRTDSMLHGFDCLRKLALSTYSFRTRVTKTQHEYANLHECLPSTLESFQIFTGTGADCHWIPFNEAGRVVELLQSFVISRTTPSSSAVSNVTAKSSLKVLCVYDLNIATHSAHEILRGRPQLAPPTSWCRPLLDTCSAQGVEMHYPEDSDNSLARRRHDLTVHGTLDYLESMPVQFRLW